MLQLIATGMALGLLGSFHCVGMCGPLALSLPINSESSIIKFLASLVYNLGRVTTYSLFGLLFGIIGQSFAFFGFQQWLSIIMGSIILLYLLMGKRFSKSTFSVSWINNFFIKLRNALGKLYLDRNFSSLFLIGLLNGLLPCGMVYMAVAGSVAAGDTQSGMLFMASFGLGTLPVMWAIAFFGNYVSVALRVKIRRAYPYLVAMMACMLILRGMGLGIPYISPKPDTGHLAIQNCSPMP